MTDALKKYQFQDGVFTFWTAHYGSWKNNARVVFRVREDSIPKVRAEEKGILCWDRILPAKPYEIELWLLSHKDYPLVDFTV